jgi:solute carrier family 35 protein F1/2
MEGSAHNNNGATTKGRGPLHIIDGSFSEGIIADDGGEPDSLLRSSPLATRGSTAGGCLAGAVFRVRSQWKILAAGQVLSFLLACSGAAQATLALDCHLSAPTFTVGLFYLGLAFCLVPLYRSRRQAAPDPYAAASSASSDEGEGDGVGSVLTSTPSRSETFSSASGGQVYDHPPSPPHRFLCLPLQAPAWVYFCMAVLDVYANYFTVLAFKYTTITSVTLFDALAIPSAMVLSKMFLTREYTGLHFAGVLACMIGVVVNVFIDVDDDRKVASAAAGGDGADAAEQESDNDNNLVTEYPHKAWGDALSIVGGVLFGANNVLGEVAVRNLGGPNEYLGMLGFFATLICLVQTMVLERDDIRAFVGKGGDKSETCTQHAARWLLLGFVASNVIGYLGGARFLQVSEATFLNLSFLTGDLWSVIFSVVAERITPKPLFFVALVFTVSGVFVYEMAPTPVVEDRQELRVEEPWREDEISSLELQPRHRRRLPPPRRRNTPSGESPPQR